MAVFRHKIGEVVEQAEALCESYEDLRTALKASPRRIPSKYFYDAKGSEIFAQISEMEEYYLTRIENEIIKTRSRSVFTSSTELAHAECLQILELGAGDGRKTVHLLEMACKYARRVTYVPIDISEVALHRVRVRIEALLPQLEIKPFCLDFEKELERLPLKQEATNLIVFLGSSLGNFSPFEQRRFLGRLSKLMSAKDVLCLGLDLKKDPRVLRRAYDDATGITRDFNINLLRRLNRELGADFDLQGFMHWPVYNPLTGSMESWLMSLREQSVRIRGLGETIEFEAFEGIHVETSWKFSPHSILELARDSGFVPIQSLYDKKKWFVDELWRRAP